MQVDENDHHEDHCEACTEGGTLLCCDNCDFAFHFTCAEPPLLPDAEIADSVKWYCRRCAFTLRQQDPAYTPHESEFGPIFDLSDSLNPHVFTLPLSIKRQPHADRDKSRDAVSLELADLMKNPDLCLPRYTAVSISETRRRKGVRFPPVHVV